MDCSSIAVNIKELVGHVVTIVDYGLPIAHKIVLYGIGFTHAIAMGPWGLAKYEIRKLYCLLYRHIVHQDYMQ